MRTLGSVESEPRPRRRSTRILRRVAVGFALAAAVGLGVVWFVRDLPRRWIEQRLAADVAARVRLGRLEVVSSDRFVLHDLVVERPSWEPRLDRVTIARLEVDGSLGEIRGGRYERLAAHDVEVTLVPAESPPPGAGTRASLPQVRLVEIHDGRLTIETDEHPAVEATFEATLHDFGSGSSGRLVARAGVLPLAPPARVFPELAPLAIGEMSEATLEASWEPAPLAIAATLATAGLVLPVAGRRVTLERPRLELTATLGSATHLVAQGTAAGVERLSVEARLDEGAALGEARFEIGGVDAGRLVASVEPPLFGRDGGELDGSIDLVAMTADGSAFDVEASGMLERLRLPLDAGVSLAARDARVAARGTWRRGGPGSGATIEGAAEATLGAVVYAPSAGSLVEAEGVALAVEAALDAAWRGPVEARLDVAGGAGHLGQTALPRELFPLTALAEGRLDTAATFDGRVAIDTPLSGAFQVAGTTTRAGDAITASWSWRWPRLPDLDRIESIVAGSSPSGEDGALRAWPAAIDVEAVLGASGTLRGRLDDPAVAGRLEVDELVVTWPGETTRAGAAGSPAAEAGATLAFRASEGDVRFRREAGGSGAIAVDPLELRGRLTRTETGAAAPGWDAPASLAARGSFAPRAATARLDTARLSVGDVLALSLSGRREGDGSTTFAGTLGPTALPALRQLTRGLVEDPAPSFRVDGRLAGSFEGSLGQGGGWEIEGAATLDEAGFSSEDGSRVVQGASGDFGFGFAAAPGSATHGGLTGSVTGPVLLWGTLFGDYSTIDSRVELTVNEVARGWQATLDWSLPRDVELVARVHSAIAADGAEAQQPLHWALAVSVPDLAAFLETYVRMPFQGSVDGIDTLRASGELGVVVDGEWSDVRRTVEGTVALVGASFAGVAGTTRVGDLDLALPVDLRWASDGPEDDWGPPSGGEPREGSLAFAELRIGNVTIPPVATRLRVEADTVRLEEDVEVDVLGGELTLEGLSVVDWSRASRFMRFALRLDELGLEPLTAALGSFPLEGTVGGYFPTVRVTQDRMVVDGGGAIDVFGGRLAVFDISGEDMLSRFPRLRFSADFSGIHLIEITRTFDFGEIHGVIEGEIRDCELFRGTPVRCRARIQSVETPGVPQKINVKAVRNIAILGSGDTPGLFDRGLHRFLDTYTYAAIGIELTLQNDRFVLRGTQRRGDRELFVRGRLPFRIDVVNVAPGQGVSFQTMLARLRALEVSTGAGREPPPRSGEPPAAARDREGP